MNKKPSLLTALYRILVTLGATGSACGQITAFDYQGCLTDVGGAANGSYDFQFSLFGAGTGGVGIGSPNVAAPVPVTNGLFNVLLDFGNLAFDGGARWLEIGVRTNGSDAGYTTLSPRQPITATPYALYSGTAARLAGNVPQTFAGPVTFSPTAGPPFAVSSSVKVADLNVDLLDGLDGSRFWQGSGNIPAAGDFLGTLNNQPLIFKTAGTEAMRIDASGSVGVGTAVPADRLHVAGAAIFQGPSPWIDVRAYGATGHDNTDDAAALQAAFDAVPPSGSVVFVPPGTYRVSRSLSLKSKTHLKGAGAATVLERTEMGGETILFSQTVTNVTVENLGIDMNGAGGGSPQRNYATALAFRTQSSNLRIRDLRIFDSTGTNMCCRHGILVLESDHVWIERNFLSDGLRIKAGGPGDNVIIENNMLEDPNDNAISIATATGPSSTVNYVIRGNTVKAARGVSIYIGDDGFGTSGDPGVPESGIVYQNILVDGNILHGPVAQGSVMVLVRLANTTERFHVVNNVLVNTGPVRNFTSGISVSIQTPFGRNGADFLIAHNTVEGLFDHAGIWVRSVKGVRIEHNQLSNGCANGIRLGGVDTATIVGNQVFNCGRGALLENSTRLQVLGNSFRGVSAEGIYLVSSDATNAVSGQFTANTVSDNARAGILTAGAGAFDVHFLFNDLRGNAGGAFQNFSPDANISGSTRLGNLGAAEYIQRHISATAAWDPPVVGTGATASTTLAVGGVAVGDTVSAGFSQPVPAGALLHGAVTAANTVTVTLANLTGAAMNLEPGMLRADVWKH